MVNWAIKVDSHPVLYQMICGIEILVEQNQQVGLHVWEVFSLLGKCEGLEGKMNILN